MYVNVNTCRMAIKGLTSSFKQNAAVAERSRAEQREALQSNALAPVTNKDLGTVPST
jgi:hypothetical protein